MGALDGSLNFSARVTTAGGSGGSAEGSAIVAGIGGATSSEVISTTGGACRISSSLADGGRSMPASAPLSAAAWTA